MTQRKKLIEVALPLEAINIASAREKSIRHGHPSTLHLWWARRPLAAARAVIFSSLVDDPDDPDAPPKFIEACRNLQYGTDPANDTPRQRLFKFIEVLVQWESTTDEQVLRTARELILLATGGNPPPFLDPFAGGGSIPLEAQRLGLEAHASDLNPVPVMINKAQIEIPPKFTDMSPVNPHNREGTASGGGWIGAAGLAADVRYYGNWMREQARQRIGHIYPDYNGETVIAWMWARTVKSPNPAINAHVPLVENWELSKKSGEHVWIEPVVDTVQQEITYVIKSGKGSAPEGTVSRNGGRCLFTGVPITREYIRVESQAGRMKAQLIAVITEHNSKRRFHAPTQDHRDVALKENPLWIPNGELSNHPQYMAPPRYGMTSIADLFTTRQLVTLTTFSDLIRDAREKAYQDAKLAGLSDDGIKLSEGGCGSFAYAEAISIYLAFAVDKMTTTNSALCSWQTNPTRLVATFGRQAVVMVWRFTEANPFSGAAGDYGLAIVSVAKVLDNLRSHTPANVVQADAINLVGDDASLLISTDPPYYDNVPYADLSDLFYIWMRPNLKSIYPTIFGTVLVPKDTELVADSQRFGNRETANQHFENGLKLAFSRMKALAHPEYPITVYYAFKQSELGNSSLDEESSSIDEDTTRTGWETMLEGLIQSGLSIDGTWPMRTELTVALKKSKNFLASSIVLVCRARVQDAPIKSRREFVNMLREELPLALRNMQSGNIPPVDMAQASIGPGMAVYSRYSKVIEPNGDRLSVRTALQIINQELDAYLAAQEGDLDGDSRFAVAWFEQHGFATGQFGNADVLARAKNTSVEGLQNAGVLEAKAGKVRLYKWSETDPGWDPTTDKRPTTWEAVHHLIERLNTHGEDGAAMLLAKMPSELAAQARQLAYRLYSICERKGWAEYARDYNALVVSWGASQERAVKFKEQYQQGRLL